ncbi:MAG: hypothetical protein K5856_07755 [Bacteroidaceae bacterium]|nr:hypothetical protein [Bacteroidaceae bacterium]
MENYSELEEMRQQIGVLKNKLNYQKIVNDNIIHNVVQEKVDTIHKVGWGIVVLGILEVPFVMWVFRELCGFSWMFCIVTALYVLSTVIYQILLNVSLQRQIRPDEDLLAVSKQLVKLKKRNVQWLFFSMPFTALWTGYLIWEAYNHRTIFSVDFSMLVYIVIFGVVLGLVIGLTVFYKRYNAMKDAVSQIAVFLPKKNQIWQEKLDDAFDSINELQ